MALLTIALGTMTAAFSFSVAYHELEGWRHYWAIQRSLSALPVWPTDRALTDDEIARLLLVAQACTESEQSDIEIGYVIILSRLGDTGSGTEFDAGMTSLFLLNRIVFDFPEGGPALPGMPFNGPYRVGERMDQPQTYHFPFRWTDGGPQLLITRLELNSGVGSAYDPLSEFRYLAKHFEIRTDLHEVTGRGRVSFADLANEFGRGELDAGEDGETDHD